MKYFFHKISQVWSLITGLSITGKYFFSKDVTVYYPRETLPVEVLESYRGPIELIGLDDDPATPKCISCLLCMQACPSNCIIVKKSKAPVVTAEEKLCMEEAQARGEKVKKTSALKNPSVWTYDYTLCSLCGICVETCPVDSIRYSHNIYLAGTTVNEFNFDLLARLRRKAAEHMSLSFVQQSIADTAAINIENKNISNLTTNLSSGAAAGTQPDEGGAK